MFTASSKAATCGWRNKDRPCPRTVRTQRCRRAYTCYMRRTAWCCQHARYRLSFPDTSADTLDIDSKILLRKTVALIATKGYIVGNIDATICAEHPKMNPHIPTMKTCLAETIGTDEDNISIKATTTERLGFTGREEGISAYATVLIAKTS